VTGEGWRPRCAGFREVSRGWVTADSFSSWGKKRRFRARVLRCLGCCRRGVGSTAWPARRRAPRRGCGIDCQRTWPDPSAGPGWQARSVGLHISPRVVRFCHQKRTTWGAEVWIYWGNWRVEGPKSGKIAVNPGVISGDNCAPVNVAGWGGFGLSGLGVGGHVHVG